MSAFASLVLLIIIAVTAMGVVAYSNYKVAQGKRVRAQLQRYKVKVEDLEDVVLALDQICDSRSIPKFVNDEVIDIYDEMMELDPKASYLKAGHKTAQIRSETLCNELTPRTINRLCNSDAHIARLRAYLNEASNILKKQHLQGKISTTEMQNFLLELEWLHLQVYVVSNIAEGHKAYSKQDISTANAFYKKAQVELTNSGHPDQRRKKMINQLADVLFGRRKSLDKELMPEDEFNPEKTESIAPFASGQSSSTETIMGDEDLSQLTEAMLIQKQGEANAVGGDTNATSR